MQPSIDGFCGCVQNRGDRGGISIMCPNGQRPTGVLEKNTFYTEPGCPAIYVNPAVKDCDADLKKIGNIIDGQKQMVEMPQLSFNPPPPTLNATRGSFNIIAVTDTPGASVHFTMDGSRPTEKSKIMPKDGINLP